MLEIVRYLYNYYDDIRVIYEFKQDKNTFLKIDPYNMKKERLESAIKSLSNKFKRYNFDIATGYLEYAPEITTYYIVVNHK